MENLNEALATLINTALSGVDTSVAFLQAELPDVIVQLLMWHGVKSGVLTVIGLLLAFVVPFAVWKNYKRLSVPYEKPEGHKLVDYEVVSALHWNNKRMVGESDPDRIQLTDSGLVFVVISAIASAGAILIGLLGLANLTWLQIWIAPKVWLLEYAANLVR